MKKIMYKGQLIVTDVFVANSFWPRLSGYMFRSRPHLPGILFEPAPAIHTFFMLFCIDVVFLDGADKIVKIYRSMSPWRHTWFHFNAKRVLELPVGVLPAGVNEGDTLEVQNV